MQTFTLQAGANACVVCILKFDCSTDATAMLFYHCTHLNTAQSPTHFFQTFSHNTNMNQSAEILFGMKFDLVPKCLINFAFSFTSSQSGIDYYQKTHVFADCEFVQYACLFQMNHSDNALLTRLEPTLKIFSTLFAHAHNMPYAPGLFF